ncbi:MAG TPA: hypothetical protein VNZ52_10255, partial [Candidatus Thermoplasmatota archaeon]|nr:hypothetical protein [Candidatus Thermoplasmatota archaeon]
LDGAPALTVRVPAGGEVTLPTLANVSALTDTTLRLAVTGDAYLTATHLVRAGERVTLAGATPLAGTAGPRTVTFTFENAGTLPASFPVGLTLNGAALAGPDVTVGPGGRADVDVTLQLPPGVSTLQVQTPWERTALRLVAGDDAVPLLAVEAARVADGTLTLPVTVENAGPGMLEGLLVVDFGYTRVETPLSLAEGARLTTENALALVGVPPGPATALVQVVRNGLPAAEATAPLTIPGPVLTFVGVPAEAPVTAGDVLNLTYVVENVGPATGPVPLRVAAGAGLEETRLFHLAQGEQATVTVPLRVEPDARDGTLPVTATLPGEAHTLRLAVTGARVEANASFGTASVPVGSLVNLTVALQNPGTQPLDLEVRASLTQAETPVARLTLAPNGTGTVQLPLRVRDDDEAHWTVSLASGRLLTEGKARILADRAALTGIRVTTDVDTVDAGGLVRVTVHTTREGRIDLLGPGIEDTFVLNGTTVREYRIPTVVATGRYQVLWNYDATNATGTVPLGVRGIEVQSTGFGLAGEAVPAVGDTVTATWTLTSSRALNATLQAWVEDATGERAGRIVRTAHLMAGANTFSFPVKLPALEPGSVRVVARLILPLEEEELPLATGSAVTPLAGLALRDVAVTTSPGAITLQVEAASGAPTDVTLRLLLGGTLLQETVLPVMAEGAAHSVTFPVPEAGTYGLLLQVTDGASEITRSLRADVPGPRVAPVTRLETEGPSFLRPDGVLVVTPATRVLVVATDEGAGVARVSVTEEGQPHEATGHLDLAPGLHELAVWATDLAGNAEVPHGYRIYVDDEAPHLTVTDPVPGSTHVAGHVLAGPVGVPTPPAAPEPVALPPTVLDSDGDGTPDALEIVEGSDPRDPASTPARYMPAPPPLPGPAVLVAGALRVRLAAVDNGTNATTLRVLVDGMELDRTDASAWDGTVDVSGLAAGDHVLQIVAEDAVGNARAVTLRLLVAPTSPEGVQATDPLSPRYPPVVPALAAWLAGTAREAPDALATQAAADATRAGAFVEGTVTPLVPPVVSGLPAHLERERKQVERALDECACVPPPLL